MTPGKPFTGSEPPAPGTDHYARRAWAAIVLAGDPDAAEALLTGLPVPRRRLNPAALEALEEPAEGEPIELTDELALALSVRSPVAKDEQPAPADGDGSAPSEEKPLDGVRIVPLDEFADTDEEGDAAILGDADNAVIPEGGDVMFYGDGGAGKTTLVVDLALHLAAGDDWQGIEVPCERRVLLIENEGPRARFRRKLRRKRDAWAGSPFDGRVAVLEAPWAAFTFADERWREILAEHIRENEVDVVIVGPVASAGMDTAGTLQEVRGFLRLVDAVRQSSGRRLVVILVHHESKGGKVSGAWEGAGDTLVHVSAQGHGRMRLEWQKTRWASDYHATALQLVWGEGETFAVEERDEFDDQAIAAKILQAIDASPGTPWGAVEKATPGVGRDRRNAVRDGLFAAGQIVNLTRDESGVDVALAYCPERKTAHLHLAEDPTICHLLPARGADGEQIAPAPGGGPNLHLLRAPPPIGGADGGAEQMAPPAEEVERLAERHSDIAEGSDPE